MIFLSFVNLNIVQKRKANKINILKLISDDKILSSVIKKAWCKCTF